MNPTDSRTPAKPVRTRLRLLTVLAAVTALAAGFATTASAVNTTAGAKGGPGKGNTAKVCGTAKAHQVRCFAELRTDVRGGKGVRGAARPRPARARRRPRCRRAWARPTCAPPTSCRPPAARTRPWRSSTPATTPPPRPTSRSTAAPTACRRAPRPTAASRR
ncbi:hypothetical protein ACFQ9X_27575 [Catenulispora yoronensis]